MIDKEEAIRLRKQGVTLQEIADRYNVTRQAVYWIVRHIQPPDDGWPKHQRLSTSSATFDRTKWGKSYHKTHLKVKGKYVYVLKRARPTACEICGKQVRKLDYHYWNVSRLDWGIWVCGCCRKHCEFLDNGGLERYQELKRQVSDKMV